MRLEPAGGGFHDGARRGRDDRVAHAAALEAQHGAERRGQLLRARAVDGDGGELGAVERAARVVGADAALDHGDAAQAAAVGDERAATLAAATDQRDLLAPAALERRGGCEREAEPRAYALDAGHRLAPRLSAVLLRVRPAVVRADPLDLARARRRDVEHRCVDVAELDVGGLELEHRVGVAARVDRTAQRRAAGGIPRELDAAQQAAVAARRHLYRVGGLAGDVRRRRPGDRRALHHAVDHALDAADRGRVRRVLARVRALVLRHRAAVDGPRLAVVGPPAASVRDDLGVAAARLELEPEAAVVGGPEAAGRARDHRVRAVQLVAAEEVVRELDPRGDAGHLGCGQRVVHGVRERLALGNRSAGRRGDRERRSARDDDDGGDAERDQALSRDATEERHGLETYLSGSSQGYASG